MDNYIDCKWNLPIEQISCSHCGSKYTKYIKVNILNGECSKCSNENLIDSDIYIKNYILKVW